MCARQRFSATHVTSMTKDRPAIVRSRRCRTTVIYVRKLKREAGRFYGSRGAKQAKRSTKAARHRASAAIRSESGEKKILLSCTPQEIHHPSTGFAHQPSSLPTLGRCARATADFGKTGYVSCLTRLVRAITLESSMYSRICMSLIASVWFAGAAPAFAESVTLFRIFLNDGTDIVSYGEYARVGDRLVFSMPIGAVDTEAVGDPSLHVVNLPVSAVNWTATEKYAELARHSHYMANSAEADYAVLTGEGAAALNAIVLLKDPKARLNMAVGARRRLASWPEDHYGYRAEAVA